MKQKLLIYVVSGLLLLLVLPAQAETLRIVTIELPPYGYLDNNQPTGLTFELTNAVAREAGFEPTNILVPFARAMDDMSSGKADVTIMFPNPEINACTHNLGMVLPMETVIISRAGSGFRSLRELAGKTVASVRGARYDDRVSRKRGFILYPVANYSQGLKMLLAGRVDGMIGPKLGLYFTARKSNIPKQALGSPLVLSVAKGSLFLSKTAFTPEKKARLLKAIAQLTEDGTIADLLAKYSL